MRKLFAFCLTAALGLALSRPASAEFFTSLGTPFFSSTAMAVSANGLVVVGSAGSRGPGPGGVVAEAFRWTQATGMVGLGDLPGDVFSSQALGVSADGSVIVGSGNVKPGSREAFRWTQATGMVGLGGLPGGSLFSTAFGVSGDGSVVVGIGNSVDGSEASIWVPPTG